MPDINCVGQRWKSSGNAICEVIAAVDQPSTSGVLTAPERSDSKSEISGSKSANSNSRLINCVVVVNCDFGN